MTRALIITNMHAPDVIGGYEMVTSECMSSLELEQGWDISCHCTTTGRASEYAYPKRVRADMTGYFPRGWTHHHALLPAAKHLAKHTGALTEALSEESAQADVTLLFNPRRLSTLQWLPAMRAARNPITWVSDYWPAEYPDCDKLHRAAEENKWAWSPAVAFGSNRVRRIYDRFTPTRRDLACIKRAAFVSDFVMRKNAPFFPGLEEACVIRNGIDHRLFPFAPMNPARALTWGFCGRIQPDKGVSEALDLFAAAASVNPELRFLLAGDMSTGHGREITRKIRRNSVLAKQVTTLGKIPREKLAEDFYHKVGTLVFTSLWDEPFALTVVEAMACGTLVMATTTGGTPEIVTESTGFPISRDNLSGATELAKHLATAPVTTHADKIVKAHAEAARITISAMAEEMAAFAAKNPHAKSPGSAKNCR